MKSFALAAICGLSTALMSTADYEFINYVALHNKVYTTTDEYAFRFDEWKKCDDAIKAHNAEGHTWTLAHNHLSDWTEDERNSINGYHGDLRTRELNTVILPESNADSVNWVTAGAVTAVKNQGSCGSCWSFSTTGGLEGAHFIATGQLESYSEEQFVQCDYGLTKNLGCNGGLMDKAFEYAKSTAIATEADYPYTSGNGRRGSCDSSKTEGATLKVTSYTDVEANSSSQLKAALDKQPVSVAIQANKLVFQLYKTGVITGTKCGTNLDHGVLAAGYGVEDGVEYYLVKNSWGDSWGEAGYVKIGVEDGAGVCGIQSGPPSYPETN